MRIVFILSGARIQDGSTKSFLILLDGVVKAGHECMVILPGKGALFDYLTNKSIKVKCLPYRFNASDIGKTRVDQIQNWIKWKRRQFINYIASYRLLNICKQFIPDIIHSNTSINNIGFLVAKRLEIPHITHIREYGDIDFNKSIHNIDFQLNYKMNFSIAITKSIASYRKLCNDNFAVIYNGICGEDEIRFNHQKKSYFLYVGRVQMTKGIKDLIVAYIDYSKMVCNPLPLFIAGDYNFTEGKQLRDELVIRLDKANLGHNVIWLGEVSNIGEYMYDATVTVIPSYNEAFGRVMPEAITNGCLVIGRDSAGTKEQFDNGLELSSGEIGLRFKDNAELTKHLYDVSCNGIEFYYPMIRRGQSVIKKIYTRENYISSILKFYNKVNKYGKH